MPDKNKEFAALRQECLKCTACGLCSTRTNVVFGVGADNAEVMFIGEGKMLTAVDLDRNKNIYIANIVKCRPPKNRDPLPEEQEQCIKWLRKQFVILRPKIIVCLGRIAAAKIIKPDIKITKEHGIFFEKDGILMMAIYHPAALLRNPNYKPDAFNDFLKLQEKIKEICTHTYDDTDK